MSQNVRRIFWNVHRLVALLNVFWNAIELGLCAVIVSSLFDWMGVQLTPSIYFIKACPCHTDCIDGCQGCENPICFCNVSPELPINSEILIFRTI